MNPRPFSGFDFSFGTSGLALDISGDTRVGNVSSIPDMPMDSRRRMLYGGTKREK